MAAATASYRDGGTRDGLRAYVSRAALSTPDFTQVYLRPSVRYQALPWLRLHGGLGWFPQRLFPIFPYFPHRHPKYIQSQGGFGQK